MPKISGATLEEHRQHIRRALFDALSTLLRETSFDAITMAQIARRAKVGRTAVYNHFADKESLLLAMMADATQEFTTVLMRALEVTDDPVQKLRIYIRSQLQLKRHYHLSEGINLRGVGAAHERGELHAHAAIVEHILHHLVDAVYRECGIERQCDTATIGLIHSCVAGMPMPSSPAQREHTMRTVENFILRALGVDEVHVAHVKRCVNELAFDDEAAVEDRTPYRRCPVNVVA